MKTIYNLILNLQIAWKEILKALEDTKDVRGIPTPPHTQSYQNKN